MIGRIGCLIGFVALAGGCCSSALAQPNVAPVVTTEPSSSFLSECVDVGYFAPYEDRGGAISQHLNMLLGQRFIPRMSNCEGSPGANGTAGCCPHELRRGAHEFCDEGKISEPYASPRNSFGSRSEAGILNNHMSQRSLAKFYIRDNQFMRENVGSQLPLGVLLSVIYQIPGSPPQQPRSEAEDDREKGDNGFTVLVDEVPQAGAISHEHAQEMGDFFLKGLAGFAIIGLGYAFLQRGRRTNNGHNNRDRKKPKG